MKLLQHQSNALVGFAGRSLPGEAYGIRIERS